MKSSMQKNYVAALEHMFSILLGNLRSLLIVQSLGSLGVFWLLLLLTIAFLPQLRIIASI